MLKWWVLLLNHVSDKCIVNLVLCSICFNIFLVVFQKLIFEKLFYFLIFSSDLKNELMKHFLIFGAKKLLHFLYNLKYL